MTHEPCRHCGSAVLEARVGSGFCCTGCAFVFQLLHDQGLDGFYHLKGNQALPPVQPQALREQDWSWLAQAAREKTELALSIQGLSCAGCVWLVQRVFSRQPGAHRLEVNISRGELFISFDAAQFDAPAFAKALQGFGYLTGPERQAEETKDGTVLDLTWRTGVCGALAMNAMAFSLPAYFGMPPDFMFARCFDLVAAGTATISVMVGGGWFFTRAWNSLRLGVMHIDTPVSLGIIAAYAGSLVGWLAGVSSLRYFDFVAMFIFLMLGGRWLQQAAVARNQRRLLRDPSIPDTVMRGEGPVPLADLRVTDHFHIQPGQAVPVLCRLLETAAAISLEWINGEGEAATLSEGSRVPAGALNIGTRPIKVEAMETWEQSALRRLLEARRLEPRKEAGLEKLLRAYLFVVVAVGLAGGLWWWWSTGDMAKAAQVMISVFVVSCPCALGVAGPLADDLATSQAARLGVFVRSLGLWKKLGKVRAVIFDKTGTLTLENPALTDAGLPLRLPKEAQKALRHLVSGNLHPASRSLFEVLGPEASVHANRQVQEETGFGLAFADESGRTWALGRPGWKTSWQDADVVFSCDGEGIAGFSFAERLRPESVSEVRRLRRRGLAVFILSGDREAKVASVARQLQLSEECWRHSLSPAEKAAWVMEHHEADGLFLGDGANDSVAFDAALCAGSPATSRSFLEHKADFYFLGHSMRFVGALLEVAARHRRAVRRVFCFSLAYNIGAAALALAGHLNPLMAAILMPLSSVATLSLVACTFAARKPPAPQEQPTDWQAARSEAPGVA